MPETTVMTTVEIVNADAVQLPLTPPQSPQFSLSRQPSMSGMSSTPIHHALADAFVDANTNTDTDTNNNNNNNNVIETTTTTVTFSSQQQQEQHSSGPTRQRSRGIFGFAAAAFKKKASSSSLLEGRKAGETASSGAVSETSSGAVLGSGGLRRRE
jgi:hypothetical protein